jgi:glycosyltransferase involved in cell wall biosynthesis
MSSVNGQVWNVAIVAWGEPADPRTFSGVPNSLIGVMKPQGHYRRGFSAKNVRFADIFSGAMTFRRMGKVLPRPIVARPWMFSENGRQKLTRRFEDLYRQSGDRGDLLQIGTVIDLPTDHGTPYIFTDMTIPQAQRHRMFDVGRMSQKKVDEAVASQKRIVNSVKHIFTVSKWTRQGLIEDYGVKPECVTPVYLGANLHIPDDVKNARIDHNILFVGIDWERKGGPLLVEAFKKVKQSLPKATLTIAGCTPQINEPGVTVEGFLDRRDPKQYAKLCSLFQRASCFCLPSLFEPFGIVFIEAASVGLPSVAIDNGSRREAVLDGDTGYLADKPSPDAVADALLRLLKDPARNHEMGEAARRYAAENFTWERVVSRIGAVIANGGEAVEEPAEAASGRAL